VLDKNNNKNKLISDAKAICGLIELSRNVQEMEAFLFFNFQYTK